MRQWLGSIGQWFRGVHRPRNSTIVLTVVFLGVLALWVVVRPESPADRQDSQQHQQSTTQTHAPVRPAVPPPTTAKPTATPKPTPTGTHPVTPATPTPTGSGTPTPSKPTPTAPATPAPTAPGTAPATVNPTAPSTSGVFGGVNSPAPL